MENIAIKILFQLKYAYFQIQKIQCNYQSLHDHLMENH